MTREEFDHQMSIIIHNMIEFTRRRLGSFEEKQALDKVMKAKDKLWKRIEDLQNHLEGAQNDW